MLLFELAWRNIWRNPRRSWVVISIIAISVISMYFYLGMNNGLIEQTINNIIDTHLSNLQIHKKGFNDDPNIKLNFKPGARLLDMLKSDVRVKSFSKRVIAAGLIQSASASGGGIVVGLEPEEEIKTTTIHKLLKQGDYLSNKDENGIVVGEKLTEKLHVGLNDKIVLMAQSLSGDIEGGAFRIKGIYKTISSDFDRAYVYINLARSQELFGLKDAVSEIAIRVHDQKQLPDVISSLKTSDKDNDKEFLSAREVMPILIKELDKMRNWTFIVAVFFGIIIFLGMANVLMMVIFERTREYGICRAIGTKPSHIFSMIGLETVFLTIIGLLIGALLGIGIVYLYSVHGLNLAVFSEALSAWGVGSRIFFHLRFIDIVVTNALIFIFGIIGFLYPAYKISRLPIIKAIYFT